MTETPTYEVVESRVTSRMSLGRGISEMVVLTPQEDTRRTRVYHNQLRDALPLHRAAENYTRVSGIRIPAHVDNTDQDGGQDLREGDTLTAREVYNLWADVAERPFEDVAERAEMHLTDLSEIRPNARIRVNGTEYTVVNVDRELDYLDDALRLREVDSRYEPSLYIEEDRLRIGPSSLRRDVEDLEILDWGTEQSYEMDVKATSESGDGEGHAVRATVTVTDTETGRSETYNLRNAVDIGFQIFGEGSADEWLQERDDLADYIRSHSPIYTGHRQSAEEGRL